MKILYVESNAVVLEDTADLLQNEYPEIQWAFAGGFEEAMELVHGDKPDRAITNLRYKGTLEPDVHYLQASGGADLYKVLHEMGIPVAFCSHENSDEIRRELVKRGMGDEFDPTLVYSKSPKQLRELVKKLLTMRAAKKPSPAKGPAFSDGTPKGGPK